MYCVTLPAFFFSLLATNHIEADRPAFFLYNIHIFLLLLLSCRSLWRPHGHSVRLHVSFIESSIRFLTYSFYSIFFSSSLLSFFLPWASVARYALFRLFFFFARISTCIRAATINAAKGHFLSATHNRLEEQLQTINGRRYVGHNVPHLQQNVPNVKYGRRKKG